VATAIVCELPKMEINPAGTLDGTSVHYTTTNVGEAEMATTLVLGKNDT